ncbi:hypothetical protein BK138_16225 [Paenibacillus rhizosphaerae]|uniref:Uncharacterized protein n=1 Tax=Paenibacillus rhizosphaerae TaxID=297318 RepID=A0A1R1ESJ2_9BACL|nr:hypothetical protein [Paenibacillus rhizosphaerae]OMF54702.1 hypothetical protein BK138_16225 [Paenibacillus rhizosphaerae]
MDKLTEIRKEHEDLQQTVSERPEYRIEAMKVLANINYLLQLVETQAKALEFYADANNWRMDAPGFVDLSVAEKDHGQRAREALTQV